MPTSYLICTSPQTGGDLLAKAIRQTDAAGYPHEYFSPAAFDSAFMRNLLGVSADQAGSLDLAGRLEHILAKGTTANGIFGATVHWAHLSPLLAAIAERQGGASSSDGDALARLKSFFPNLKFIRLYRRNHVAQAISFQIAKATRRRPDRDMPPGSVTPAEPEIDYDFAAIGQRVRIAQREEQNWQNLLPSSEAQTVSLAYEDLAGDYEAAIGRVLAFIAPDGVAAPLEKMPSPPQPTALSARWEERFRDEEVVTAAKAIALPGPRRALPRADAVERSVFICSSPRTGSNLLATTLRNTGLAGRPYEYFCPAMLNAPTMLKSLGLPRDDPNPPDLAERLELILAAGTSRNGVFAATVHWGHLQALAAAIAIRRGDPTSVEPSIETLRAVFPDLRFVWLRRENDIAQGISHFVAKTTGRWFQGQRSAAGARHEGDIAYDFEGIHRLVRVARRDEEGWRRFLAPAGDAALPVTYEALTADFPGTIARVMTFVGAEPSEWQMPSPPLARQAGPHSVALEERYRRDALAGQADMRRH